MTDTEFWDRHLDGVAIAAEPARPTATMTGDEAAALITQIHNVGLSKGYERVRLDRGQHPSTGDYYEAGYVHGEVTVRYSHRPRRLFRYLDDRAATLIAVDLGENARRALNESAPDLLEES